MLKTINTFGATPTSHILDPSSTFQPGQIAQLKQLGNQVLCGVSDGTAPLGIIDEIKTEAFTRNQVDERVLFTPDPSIVSSNGKLTISIQRILEHSNIVPDSFISRSIDVFLIPNNGVVEFQINESLNFDIDDDGINDSIITYVSYTYRIPNIPGDDSTLGSGKITVWMSRLWASTDQFDSTCRYPINAPLFVSEKGQFTTRQVQEGYPCLAMVMAPPTSTGGLLDFLWL